MRGELHPLVNTETSLLVCGALAVAAYDDLEAAGRGDEPRHARRSSRGARPHLREPVHRREPPARRSTQIVGFLMLENGIALLALLGAYGVPLIVEMGVFLDVLLGVLVMQAVVISIHETWPTEEAASTRGFDPRCLRS